ncbi:class I SAM-dependent methyltransferase [Lysobacter sp. CA199]|uniref:class I SAM-dependent methyltransferase n=1 Tax=Lysobacter sp. CA199 TaxID=3455608 RepID=UPI003F8D4A2B
MLSAAGLSQPPTMGEIWRPIRDANRAVVVVRCAAESIEYAWLDSQAGEVGVCPAAQWDAQFEIVLEQSDHAHATPVRRRYLIDDHAPWFRGRSVLELGAHTGGLTQSILDHAGAVTVVENNPRCTRHLRDRFADRVEIVEGDMHHALWDFAPCRFELVVCAGVLYHSAHPFLLLEAMAYLKPRRILIDTLNHGVTGLRAVVPHMINSCNYRYNQRPDCGLSVVVGDGLIEQALGRLGYAKTIGIDKQSARIDREHDSTYFQEWKNSYSAWFHAADTEPAAALTG